MIEGIVNASHEAVVALRIQGPTGRSEDIEAVVDTGYSGFLTLPVALVERLGLEFTHIGHAFLANGDEASFDVYDAAVLWDGQPRRIRADAIGGAPLMGMLLLDGHDLHVEIVEGGRVVIEARV